MKRTKLLLLAGLATMTLTGCENQKVPGGNQMVQGSRSYYYAYVKSQAVGNKYYHIDGWKEYGPEPESGFNPYIGLELQLFVSRDVVYYWEQGLSYVLMKNYNPIYGEVIE